MFIHSYRNNIQNFIQLSLQYFNIIVIISVCDNLIDDWPSEGRIHFENVSFKYDLTLLPIINKVTFTIQPQEKVKYLHNLIFKKN